jgi:hypothetical protein
MYRGQAKLMETNPMVKWVFGSGVAACLLLTAACIVLPGKTKLIAVVVVVGAMLVVYPRMLSRALVPRPDRVTLYVDESGVYADDAPYALRGDITAAYIRPALTARNVRHVNYGGSVPTAYSLDLPKYPLTVELMTRRGQLNINPGSQDAAAEILVALGFPVTMCTPDRVAGATRRQWVMSAVIVVVVLVAVFAYSAYMSHRVGGAH